MIVQYFTIACSVFIHWVASSCLNGCVLLNQINGLSASTKFGRGFWFAFTDRQDGEDMGLGACSGETQNRISPHCVIHKTTTEDGGPLEDTHADWIIVFTLGVLKKKPPKKQVTPLNRYWFWNVYNIYIYNLCIKLSTACFYGALCVRKSCA